MRPFVNAMCIACSVLALGIGKAAAQDEASQSDAIIDTCGPHRTTILNLAERIIAEKSQAEGLSGRNFGAASAYLILHYGDVDLASGMNLLVRVQDGARRGPRGLDDVRLAFAISKLGPEDGLTVSGRTATEVFAGFSPAVMRQILLADAGERFFRLLADVRADPALIDSFEALYAQGFAVHGWVLDQSDDFKLRLARNAEGAGELVIAAMVLGSRRDLTEYNALLERRRDTNLDDLAGPKWLTSYLATVLHQSVPVPVPGDSPERQDWRADQFDIMRAAFRMGGLAWLGILYNQTGADDPIALASRDFLTEIDAGRLDARIELEPAWAYLYTRLAQEMGADTLRQAMTGFTLPRSTRHYAEDAQTTLDWVNARQALVPYLTGTETELPPRPALLTSGFDWTTWTELATMLRDDDKAVPSDTGSNTSIVAELLLAKGDVERALNAAQNIMPNTNRLWFYRDVMIRLDRRCDAYTLYPGSELVTGGAILFKFD